MVALYKRTGYKQQFEAAANNEYGVRQSLVSIGIYANLLASNIWILSISLDIFQMDTI